MADRPFRFIHAGDLHLERPLFGIADLPDHLHDLCVDAPYRAAQRVFDCALLQSVDFVLLCGDVLSIEQCGPRGLLFLREQFERLNAQEIGVYWVGGETDPPDAWPSELKLPPNVRFFSRAKPEAMTISRKGAYFAHMIGLSYARRRAIKAADFTVGENHGLFTIVAAHGDVDRETLLARDVGYWALGGRHERQTVTTNPTTAYYPGSPQAREPSEIGPHGCTLVEVVPGTTPHLQFLPCDSVRFINQKITLEVSTTRDQLDRLIESRMADMIASATGLDLFVSWTFGGRGRLLSQMRHGSLATEIINNLRKTYGHRNPAIWSASITAQPDIAVNDDLLKQDTILGEYLRAVDYHLREDERADQGVLDLADSLTELQRNCGLGPLVSLADPTHRDRILRRAAALGTDVLSGGEAHA